MSKRFSRLSVLVAASLLAAAGASASAAAGELTATVRGGKPNSGTGGGGMIMIAAFDSAEAMAADRPVAGQRLSPAGGEVRATFHNLPAGRYLLAAYQDADGDGKLSVNLFGVPLEAYGFGGDPPSRFGPPAFDAAAVAVGDAPVDLIVTLKP